jgi:hypothetical protein
MLNQYQSAAGAGLVIAGMLAVTADADAKLLQASVLTGNVPNPDTQLSGTAFEESVGPRSSARATAPYGLLRAIGQAAEVGSFPWWRVHDHRSVLRALALPSSLLRRRSKNPLELPREMTLV